jgi:class 3 adenylate cyclase
MICANCGASNRAGRKFCTECGTSLSLACSNCGSPVGSDEKFCGECGAPLSETVAEPRATHAEDGMASPPQRERRKTVTILFSDVMGSTALGERLESEILREIMGRYFDEARAVIERHGGTVEKFIGDAVMAVFGVPLVHEDDALRSVRAAVALRDAVASLNVMLDRQWGARLEIRTGVNTGSVIAGDPAQGQNFVTGDAVNVAARLEQAAAPGEILVGSNTLRLVRDAVMVEKVEPLVLKGKRHPVEASKLVAVSELAPGVARRLDSPIVGRQRELDVLGRVFDACVEQRSCQLVALVGAAGLGKSRLTHEFARQVESRATVLRGRCLPYGDSITFWPLSEALKDAAGIVENDTVEDARRKLGDLVAADVNDAQSIYQRVAGLLGLAPAPAGLQETFWALRKLLERLANERPVVLIIDDAHWAEPTLLDLVDYIVDFCRGAAITMLCNARPELLDQRPAWSRQRANSMLVRLVL